MGNKIISYSQDSIKGQCFVGDNIPDLLISIAGWIRQNQPISIVAMTFNVTETDREEISVYWE